MKAESIANIEMAKTPFWQEVLGRGLNEGIEEVMEESVTDTYKLFSKGLEALGINVTDKIQILILKKRELMYLVDMLLLYRRNSRRYDFRRIFWMR